MMDVVLTKKSTFDKTYEKTGVAGPHLSTHERDQRVRRERCEREREVKLIL